MLKSFISTLNFTSWMEPFSMVDQQPRPLCTSRVSSNDLLPCRQVVVMIKVPFKSSPPLQQLLTYIRWIEIKNWTRLPNRAAVCKSWKSWTPNKPSTTSLDMAQKLDSRQRDTHTRNALKILVFYSLFTPKAKTVSAVKLTPPPSKPFTRR